MVSFFRFGKKKNKNLSQPAIPVEEKGIIGRYYENDLPVIVKFVDEFSEKELKEKFPMLTVVSWKYEGATNNGMPLTEINEKMIVLEEAIEKAMDKSKQYQHAYSRTGNNLKEFVYYSSSKDQFMTLLNETLATHERYPIEINFYEDPEWSEFKKLIEDFKK